MISFCFVSSNLFGSVLFIVLLVFYFYFYNYISLKTFACHLPVSGVVHYAYAHFIYLLQGGVKGPQNKIWPFFSVMTLFFHFEVSHNQMRFSLHFKGENQGFKRISCLWKIGRDLRMAAAIFNCISTEGV